MSTIAELLIKLGMDDGGLDKGMSSSQSKLKSWGESLRSVGTKLTAGVTLPLVGAGLAAINWASDQQEAANKVDVVFGKSAAGVKKWAKSTEGSLLLSNAAAMEAAGTYGNLFTSMGLGQDEAADLSMELVELAQDLSSFNNVPTDQALIALRAALVGEYEPMRALGVQLSQATVEQKALEMGIWDGNGALDAQARILATNALIMEQTTNAQGDAARTATGFANQTRILRANLEDLGASIGERLLPVANRFLSFLIDLVDRMQGLDPFWQNLILGFAGIAAAIGPALLMLGFMLPALGALIPVFAALVSPIGLVAIALAALVAVGVYAWVNDLWGVRDAVAAVTDYLKQFRPALDDFVDAMQALREGDFDEVLYELRDAVFSLGVALTSQQISDKLRDIADQTRKASDNSKDYPKTLDAIAESMDSNAKSVDGYRGAFQLFQQGNYGEGLKKLGLAALDANTAFQQYGQTLLHFLGETGLKFAGWLADVTGIPGKIDSAWGAFEDSGLYQFLEGIINKIKEVQGWFDKLKFWQDQNAGNDRGGTPRQFQTTGAGMPGSGYVTPNNNGEAVTNNGTLITNLPNVGSGATAFFNTIKSTADQIASTITQMATNVGNALKQVDSAFQQTGQQVASQLQQMQSRSQQVFQQIAQTATQSTNQLRSAVTSGWQQTAQQVQQQAQQMQQRVQQAFQQMQSQATNSANQMRSSVTSAMSSMVSSASSSMSQFTSRVQSGFQQAVGAAQSGVSQIRSIVSGLNLSGPGYSIGASLGQGIAAGIQAYIGTVASAAAALVSTAIAAAQSAAAAHSPSRKMMQLGSDMAEGMEIGINRGADAVERATAGLVNIPSAQPWQQTGNAGQPIYVSIALKSEELVDLIRKVEDGYGFASDFGTQLGLYTGQP